jgi:hypothetical protein
MLKPLLAAVLLAACISPAVAQSALDQSLNGVVRGIQSQNSSGQVGEVLFSANSLTVEMQGTNGRAEMVTLNRGFQCSDNPGSVFARLGKLSNGRLTALAPIPNDRMLSGNYLVVVHNNTADSRAVACGQLYRR